MNSLSDQNLRASIALLTEIRDSVSRYLPVGWEKLQNLTREDRPIINALASISLAVEWLRLELAMREHATEVDDAIGKATMPFGPITGPA